MKTPTLAIMEQSLLYSCILISFCIINVISAPTPPPTLITHLGFTGFDDDPIHIPVHRSMTEEQWFDEAQAISQLFIDLQHRLQALQASKPAKADPSRVQRIIGDMKYQLGEIQSDVTRLTRIKHSYYSRSVSEASSEESIGSDMLAVVMAMQKEMQHSRDVSRALQTTFYDPAASICSSPFGIFETEPISGIGCSRSHSTRRHRKSSSESLEEDSVHSWLEEIKEEAKGDTDIYKLLDIGKHRFYRIGNFQIPVNKEGTDHIHIPLYILQREFSQYNFFILPENFYKEINKKRSGEALKSNKDL
eukprot:70250_1